MKRLLGFLGMLVGGWAGWALGALLSTFTAFVFSVIGTAVGLYMANRLATDHLP